MGAIAKAEGDVTEADRMNREARASAIKRLEVRPKDPEIIGDLISTDAVLGNYDEALAEDQRVKEIISEDGDALVEPLWKLRLVEIFIAKGDRDSAVTSLNELVKVPFALSAGDLELDPMWDSLRDGPRFAELIEAAKNPIALD